MVIHLSVLKPMAAGACFCAAALVTAETQPTTTSTYIALITSLIGLATVVGGLVLVLRRVKEVHVLVNSNLTKVMERLGIEQERTTGLATALKDAGVPVPPRPDAEGG